MVDAATILTVTFALGFTASLLRLPPLVGFLAAGFVLNGMGFHDIPLIDTVADLGVTLLLFAIGLKLDVRTLMAKEVWLTTGLTLVINVSTGLGLLSVLSAAGYGLAHRESMGSLAIVALGLAFSSTVFVIKLLEERGDTHAFYARIAIGVLVVQDIVAVVFLTLTTGHLPSPWALALVLLWPAARLFRSIWGRLGHGEMQSMFGILMAVVPGYLLFELVGLKGDLGALIMGVLLASHPSATELSRSLFHVKELLLVGFFLSIGMAGGLPTWSQAGMALVLLLLLPAEALAYSVVLWTMRVRHRTGWLVGFGLAQFSEFGLIVADVGSEVGLVDPEWLVVLSLALSLGFVFSALVNGVGQPLVERLAEQMPAQNPNRLHPEDRPSDITGAEALVVGLGRVGRNAYARLHTTHGLNVVGLDSDVTRVEKLRDLGMRAVEADGRDEDFLVRLLGHDAVRLVVVALPTHCADVVHALRAQGFTGTIATADRYEDGVQEALAAGADMAFNAFAATGLELADQAIRAEDAGPPDPSPYHRG